MKLSIIALKEKVSLLSSILKNVDPSTLFLMNNQNFVACSNYDKDSVDFLTYKSKHFGVQAILESIAKDLGFNTYNGMLQSNEPEFELRPTALMHLNPNPKNAYYTRLWQVLSAHLIDSITHNCKLDNHVARNTKLLSDEDKASKVNLYSTSLVLGDTLAVQSQNMMQHLKYFGIAQSIYIQSMTYLTEAYDDNVNLIFEAKVPLKEFLTHYPWTTSDKDSKQSFSEFALGVTIILTTAFQCSNVKFENAKGMRFEFDQNLDFDPTDATILIETFQRNQFTMDNHIMSVYRDAVKAILPEIYHDKTYYYHPDFDEVNSPEWKSNEFIAQFGEKPKGTKAFWVNVSYPIFQRQLDRGPHSLFKTISVERIVQFLRSEVIGELRTGTSENKELRLSNLKQISIDLDRMFSNPNDWYNDGEDDEDYDYHADLSSSEAMINYLLDHLHDRIHKGDYEGAILVNTPKHLKNTIGGYWIGFDNFLMATEENQKDNPYEFEFTPLEAGSITYTALDESEYCDPSNLEKFIKQTQAIKGRSLMFVESDDLYNQEQIKLLRSNKFIVIKFSGDGLK